VNFSLVTGKMYEAEVNDLIAIRKAILRRILIAGVLRYMLLVSALMAAAWALGFLNDTLPMFSVGVVGYALILVFNLLCLEFCRADFRKLEQILAALPEAEREPVLAQAGLQGLPQRLGPIVMWWPARRGLGWRRLCAVCHLGAGLCLLFGAIAAIMPGPAAIAAVCALLAAAMFELYLLGCARRRASWLCLALTCGIAAVSLGSFSSLPLKIGALAQVRIMEGLQSGRTSIEVLLHQTDFQALLAGCREMMIHRKEYRVDPNGYGGERDPKSSWVDPADPKLPVAVRELVPTYILVQDDMTLLELCGGFDHYGVRAYAKGSKRDGEEGGVRLIDGLWYYSEGRW
jgi:hypothetical protein